MPAKVGYNDMAQNTVEKTGVAVSVFGGLRRKGDMAGGAALSPGELFD